MALIALDSFDHYTSVQTSAKWRNAFTLTDSGRTGKGGWGGTASIPVKLFDLSVTVCAGVAYKTPTLASIPLYFGNDVTGVHVEMRGFADGRINVKYVFGNSNDTSESSPVRLNAGEWYYLEFKCTQVNHPPPVNTSDVIFECRINGENVLAGTVTVNGCPTETGFTSCTLRGPEAGAATFDDFYITDGEFLGDVRIYVIRPDGDSTPSQWDAINAGPHYQEVDDITPDGNTSYLYTATLDKVDMVILENIAVTGTIKGIQLNHYAQKDDAGLAAFRAKMNISASDYEIAIDRYLSYAAWINYTTPLRLNPITAAAFTVDEINAMTMGIKRTI